MILLNFGVLPPSTSFLLICVIVALAAGALFGAWLQRHVDATANDEDLVDKFVAEQQAEQFGANVDKSYNSDYDRAYWDITEHDMRDIKDKIRNYLKAKSISQTNIAKRTGVSPAHVSRMLSTNDDNIKIETFTIGRLNSVLQALGLKAVLISTKTEKFIPKVK